MMKFKTLRPIRIATGQIATAAAMLAATLTPATATRGAVSTRETHVVTAVATVKSIDPATRRVVLTRGGESFSLIAPPKMQNFDQLKVGDKVKASYRLEAEFVLSKPNAKLPPNTDAMIAARAAKGELPAAAVAQHVVVTGAVLGVDLANHTLKIVDKRGGQVHTIDVSPENRAQLVHVKVGDYITAYVTESMLVSVARP